MNSYLSLQGGDAVVFNNGTDGHTFIIGVNKPSRSKVCAMSKHLLMHSLLFGLTQNWLMVDTCLFQKTKMK